MFAGFRSRWMIPCSCAASSASAICFAIGNASSIGSPLPQPFELLGQILALDQFHHQRPDVAALLDAVDRSDVGSAILHPTPPKRDLLRGPGRQRRRSRPHRVILSAQHAHGDSRKQPDLLRARRSRRCWDEADQPGLERLALPPVLGAHSVGQLSDDHGARVAPVFLLFEPGRDSGVTERLGRPADDVGVEQSEMFNPSPCRRSLWRPPHSRGRHHPSP